jgi:hypothetical protein
MAKRKQIEITGDETAASPDGAPEQAQAKSELPNVESPPVSPGSEIPAIASDTPAIEPIAAAAPVIEPVAETAPVNLPRLVLKVRYKRYALLAASVAIAAALGAVIGAVASGGFGTPLPRTDVAGAEERKAMQVSIAHLSKEVSSLKTSLDAANKAAHSQIAKITERFDRAASSDITGSISAPQTIAPLPSPRPPQRAAEAAPSRPPVVKDWSIRETRDGYVYVQGHGDVYQVVPGAPLPGLGPVESVTRQDGRWVVTTPKGIIVSMRDRGYFGSF